MEGFLLFDEKGRKLTRYLAWSTQPEAGWLWSDAEANAVLEISKYWNKRPVYYQRCALKREPDGDVNVIGLEAAKKI